MATQGTELSLNTIPDPTIPARPTPLSGRWNVVITCPEGNSVNEMDAYFDRGLYRRDFGSGLTKLSLGLQSDGNIQINGFVLFKRDKVLLPVKAIGVASDDSYTGSSAQVANSFHCKLNAARLK
jgi:hypothetical protein